MHYKTIVLELIQDRPELYERLRSSKRLLPAVDAYATELRSEHLALQAQILSRRPGSEPSQIAAEALEMAIDEFQGRLPSASPADEAETLSLDAAMPYLRRATPRA